MKRSIPASTKRRGRPKTTGPGQQIVVRVQAPLLAALDKFIASEATKMSRPEAVRLLLTDSLTGLGILNVAATTARRAPKSKGKVE